MEEHLGEKLLAARAKLMPGQWDRLRKRRLGKSELLVDGQGVIWLLPPGSQVPTSTLPEKSARRLLEIMEQMIAARH